MLTSKHLYLFTIGLIILTLNACTIKKRSYQKGYYVDWHLKTKPNIETEPKNDYTTQKKTEKQQIQEYTNSDNTALADNHKQLVVPNISSQKNKLSFKDTCGDMLTLKIGEELQVKVLEINETQIKYKRCDNINGPLYTIGKEKVYAITFSNGIKEVIEAPEHKETPTIQYIEKEFEKNVKRAAFLTFVPIINYIGIFFGVYYAIKGKRIILSNPGKYKGINLAKFILTFDALLLLLLVVIVFAYMNIITFPMYIGISLIIGMLIVGFAAYYALK